MMETEESRLENSEQHGSEDDLFHRAHAHLQQLLSFSGGIASSTQVNRELLKQLGVDEEAVKDLTRQLRLFAGSPDTDIYRHGYSFCTKEKYQELERVTGDVANQKESEAEETFDTEEVSVGECRQYRKEEARMGAYVVPLIEEIYASESAPEGRTYVFDVHDSRPGGEYQNVDLLAVHWRSRKVIELVAVEVKLDFTARAVQQACSYTRFAHRTWLAVKVVNGPEYAAWELWTRDPGLFDHAVARGIGIIGCKATPGRAYTAFPIQWPKRHEPDPFEREQFLEHYREWFEDADVLEQEGRARNLKL